MRRGSGPPEQRPHDGFSLSEAPHPAGRAEPTGWLLDSHVHLHRSFDTATFLGEAIGNFAAVAGRMLLGTPALGCLVLTESRGCNSFQHLRDGGGGALPRAWSVAATREKSALLFSIDRQPQLVIIAGKQVRTREDLEILALGCLEPLPDGLPIAETLALAAHHSFATVLPWGFGKWRFRRRRIVEDLLNAGASADLFVGDNGNRPRLLPSPRIFRMAAHRGIRNLPGSDPLPLASHVTRAGRCGVFLPCVPDTEMPSRQIAALLADASQPETFVTPEPLPRFLHAQLHMQVRKHFRSGRGRRSASEPAAG